jgi:hypothetical protein
MKIVSPIQFKEAFEKVSSEVTQELIDLWQKPKEYTKFMRSTILPRMADELCLEVYCHVDYWKLLDAIFYERKDTLHFADDMVYAEYITIAVEFENLPRDSRIEMNKLQLFNTPLKVLITYADEATAEDLLAIYARIMNTSDVFSDFSTQRRQLVIFGPDPFKIANQLNWTFHIFDNGSFKSI